MYLQIFSRIWHPGLVASGYTSRNNQGAHFQNSQIVTPENQLHTTARLQGSQATVVLRLPLLNSTHDPHSDWLPPFNPGLTSTSLPTPQLLSGSFHPSKNWLTPNSSGLLLREPRKNTGSWKPILGSHHINQEGRCRAQPIVRVQSSLLLRALLGLGLGAW